MRAAEAFWLGRDEAFEVAIDRMIPSALRLDVFFDAAKVKNSAGRDGVAWKADVLQRAKPITAYLSFWKASMETEIVATEAANRAMESLERLDAAAKQFRSVVKNDLTAMKASSDRVQTEVSAMADRYKQATQLLTSEDFERALSNAERMATALKAISELSETKLSVAVFGGKPV